MEVASMRSFSSAGSSKFASKSLQKKLSAVKETEAEQDPNSATRTSRRSRLYSINDHVPSMEELSGEVSKSAVNVPKAKGVPSMKDLIEEAKREDAVPSMEDLIEEAKNKDASRPKKTLEKV